MVATCPQCGLQTSAPGDRCAACGAALHAAGVTEKTPAGQNDPATTPDLDVPNIALPALEESGRWGIVLCGLHALHLSVVLGLAGLICLAAALLVYGEGLGYVRGLVIGALVGHVTVGVVVLLGLGACCAVPILRARRFVSAGLIMGVLSVILVTTVGLGHAPAFEWRFPALTRDPWFSHLAFHVLLLNGAVALFCWIWFLRELTAVFFGPRHRTSLNLTSGFVFLWFSAAALTPLVGNAPAPDSDRPAIYCLAILGGASVVLARFHAPLQDLRRTLGRMVRQRGQ